MRARIRTCHYKSTHVRSRVTSTNLARECRRSWAPKPSLVTLPVCWFRGPCSLLDCMLACLLGLLLATDTAVLLDKVFLTLDISPASTGSSTCLKGYPYLDVTGRDAERYAEIIGSYFFFLLEAAGFSSSFPPEYIQCQGFDDM